MLLYIISDWIEYVDTSTRLLEYKCTYELDTQKKSIFQPRYGSTNIPTAYTRKVQIK
jgi:hypothetical protein